MVKKFLVFPGQGSQYAGMGKDWFDNFKAAQLVFEEACDFTGLNLRKLCFDGTDYDLKATEITQPAILTTTVAVYRSLAAEAEIAADSHLFAGHSLGEFSALACLGAIEVGPAAKLVKRRGQLMQDAVPAGKGSMAAIIFKPKTDGAPLALALCATLREEHGENAWVANFNSPEQIVISGEKSAIEKAISLATQAPYGARKAVELPVSAPFHCEMMRKAADGLQNDLASAGWRDQPTRTYVANIDAVAYAVKASEIPARLEQQITGSVRWVESVQRAILAGCAEAVEIGPGKVLSGLIKRIDFEGQTLEAKNVDTWKEYKDVRFPI